MRSFLRRSAMVFVVGAFAVTATLATQARPATQPATQAPAAGTGLKIAFINASALLRGMPGYAKAESTFTKEAEVANGEAQKLRAGFDSVVAQYQQQQAMLTPTNRTAREKQLQAQQDSLQGKLQQLQGRVDAKERELLTPMQDRLKAIIEGMRAEGNYALIIDLGNNASQNIVAYDKSLDITLRVAQRLAQSN